MKDKFTNSIYLHISNSGVRFSVNRDPEFGPTIIIEATAFGHELHTMKLHTTKGALRKVAEMFEAAADADYGAVTSYCAAAEARKEE